MLRISLLLFYIVLLINPTQVLGDERINVILPRTIFLAGETVPFRIGLKFYGDISPSQIAYAELVDRNGQPIAQEIIRINDQWQGAHIDIPLHVISDHYLLRVYSRIGLAKPETIFNQFITVINQNRPVEAVSNSKTFQKRSDNLTVKLEEKPVHRTNEKIIYNLPVGQLSDMHISIALKNPFLKGDFSKELKNAIYKDQTIDKIIPELYGHIVTGTITSAVVDTTETYFLSAHGSKSMLFTAKPNQYGELYFDLGPMDHHVEFLILQSAKWKRPLNAIIESPFPILQFDDTFSFPELAIDATYYNYFKDLQIAKEVASHFYQPIEMEERKLVTGVYLDETFILDDYNRFDDLSTTVKEYIPKVRVRRQNGETIFRVVNEPFNTLFEREPLILLDAMPVFNVDLLGSFNPELIKTMGFVYKDFYLNKDVFQGVISLSSFDNDLAGFPIPDNAMYIPYKGTQRARDTDTIMGKLRTKSDFYPDFRTVLLWDNEVDPNTREFCFFTSAVTGTFEIKIKFRNEEGNELEIYEVFEVQER